MTPKKNEKKQKTKKSMCGALLPSKTSGVERSSPFQSGGWCPLFFHLTQKSRRRFRRRRRHLFQRLEEDGREFPKTGRTPTRARRRKSNLRRRCLRRARRRAV